jgi:hypothetical protein
MGMKLKLFSFFLLVMAAIACKKQDNIVTEKPAYSGPVMVNFNNYFDENNQSGYLKVELPLKDTIVHPVIQVKISNSVDAAPADIAVYFKKVDAIVSDYNAANGTSLTPLASTSIALDIDYSKPAIIKKGTRVATFPISVNPLKLDLNNLNAIGLAIDHVEGASLNVGAESKLVIEFGTRNQYDGYYFLRGRTLHPTNAALAGPVGPYADVPLITSGPTSVIMGDQHPWANGSGSATPAGYEPTYVINPATNAVTVVNTFITAENIPGVTNSYNPTTKTIYAAWRYNASGGYRQFYDTLIYDRPR